ADPLLLAARQRAVGAACAIARASHVARLPPAGGPLHITLLDVQIPFTRAGETAYRWRAASGRYSATGGDQMRPKTVGATYLLIGAIFAAFVAVLVAVVVWSTPAPVQGTALIQPVVALVILTAIVFVLMVVYRNLALIRGAASLRYFQSATVDQPAEKVERPARAYANLLELPVLFYAVCLLMLTTGTFDSIQVSLAWVFVAARYAH